MIKCEVIFVRLNLVSIKARVSEIAFHLAPSGECEVSREAFTSSSRRYFGGSMQAIGLY